MSLPHQRESNIWSLGLRDMASPAGAVGIARILLLGVLATMLVSTSVAIGFEIASYIVFASASGLRRRFVDILHHPVTIALLAFALIVTIATFYGHATWRDALGALVGWRRLLLLPLAAAVFDDDASKRLLLKTILVTCLIGTLVSYVGVLGGFSGLLGFGIVFRNYATQGMTFSVAAVACMATFLYPQAFAGDRLLGNRLAMAAALVAIVVDIVFVLSGRSGYVSIIVMAVIIVVLLTNGSWRTKSFVGGAALLCVAIVVVSSTLARNRIEQAFHEIATLDQAPEGTSLGVRGVMWRNTVRMIRDHPIFGVGTGGFQDGYRPYVEGISGWQGHETGDPHNQFLKIAGEQGIIGLGAFLFLIFRILTCPAPAPYRQLAIAILVGWCATSLANSHFSTFVESRLLFFFVGAMLAGRPGLNGDKLPGQP